MSESKYKLKVNLKDLKEILSMPVMENSLKKGDIVELTDEKTGISRKCKVKKITNINKNPYYRKVHFSPCPFEIAEILTGKMIK
ncbi:MAG: hypothetical protein PHW73_01725 [Atribacterota bacterium]|nr:hypothetical protein [Atribacterota bacterium]